MLISKLQESFAHLLSKCDAFVMTAALHTSRKQVGISSLCMCDTWQLAWSDNSAEGCDQFIKIFTGESTIILNILCVYQNLLLEVVIIDFHFE